MKDDERLWSLVRFQCHAASQSSSGAAVDEFARPGDIVIVVVIVIVIVGSTLTASSHFWQCQDLESACFCNSSPGKYISIRCSAKVSVPV